MIVLDTHTLVWWLGSDRSKLSVAASEAIQLEMLSGKVVVSSISAWEIAMLVQKNKLNLSMNVLDWLDFAAQIERLQFVPVDNKVAVASQFLPGEFHADPADRIIVSLARELSAALVTADDKIRRYPHVRTIW